MSDFGGNSISNIGSNATGFGGLISEGMDSISSQAKSLTEQMEAVKNLETEDQTAAMIELQFQIGQYNTMVELTSSVTKSLSDSLKSVAQKL